MVIIAGFIGPKPKSAHTIAIYVQISTVSQTEPNRTDIEHNLRENLRRASNPNAFSPIIFLPPLFFPFFSSSFLSSKLPVRSIVI